MIHQSKLFVCPGECYGISWNICIARQKVEFKACQSCACNNWQEKGGLSFDPHVGAFTETPDHIDIEDEKYRQPDPTKVPVYKAEARRFLPEDIGLGVENGSKKRNWIQKLYDAI
jgi:hypothetical protein